MILSILVPVYNAERFLEPFVRGLAAQKVGGESRSTMEVIFVDDCSTDGSLRLLKKLCGLGGLHGAQALPTVRIIEFKKNGGVSEARQKALEAATGKYVIFADPDDWMEAGMYAGLVDEAERSGSDLVWENYFLNDERVNCRLEGAKTGEDLILAILAGKLHGATWNKLIRREFIERCGARFLNGRVGLCEDVDFLCQVLMAGPKCVYHDACHYHYRVVEGSATHEKIATQLASLKIVGEHLKTVLKTGRTRRALVLWRLGSYAAPIGGLKGKVLHLLYRILRSMCR